QDLGNPWHASHVPAGRPGGIFHHAALDPAPRPGSQACPGCRTGWHLLVLDRRRVARVLPGGFHRRQSLMTRREMRCTMSDQPTAEVSRQGRSIALWVGVLGAPVLWLTQFEAGYALAPWACKNKGQLLLHLISALCIVLAL